MDNDVSLPIITLHITDPYKLKWSRIQHNHITSRYWCTALSFQYISNNCLIRCYNCMRRTTYLYELTSSWHKALLAQGPLWHSSMSVWHVSPVYPGWQVHVYSATWSTHVAPFSHGEVTQSSSSISQFVPIGGVYIRKMNIEDEYLITCIIT